MKTNHSSLLSETNSNLTTQFEQRIASAAEIGDVAARLLSTPSAQDQIAKQRIPLWLKSAFTLFMCVLVPVYWRSYGPTNFLYFCDVAMFMTLAAIWLESSLLVSMAAVGILMPQMLWVVDFVGGLVGFHPVGLTKYMFNPEIKIFARGLSLFHGWLPFLLLFLVYRLGYNRRALFTWTALAWGLLFICYFFMPAPPAPLDHPSQPVNINYVYGFSETARQTWMNPHLYFAMLLVALPLLVYAPTHWILKKFLCVNSEAALIR